MDQFLDMCIHLLSEPIIVIPLELPQPEKDLKLSKIEIGESNIHESHLNPSEIDQETNQVPIETVASQENSSAVNTDKSFKCQQCGIQFSNESHLNRHKNTGCLYKEGIKYSPVVDEEIQEVTLGMDSYDVKLEEEMGGDHLADFHPVVPKFRLHEKCKHGWKIPEEKSDDQQTFIGYGHFYYDGRLWVPPKMKKKKGRPKMDGSLFTLDRQQGKLPVEEKLRIGRPLKNVQGCQTKDEYEHAKKCWIEFLKSKDKEKAMKEWPEKSQKRKNYLVCKMNTDFPLVDQEIQEVSIEPKMETENDLFQMKSHDLNLEAVIESNQELAIKEGNIDVGDGCWIKHELVTNLRWW